MKTFVALIVTSLTIVTGCAQSGGTSGSGTGNGGSTSRFSIQGDYLYLLNVVKEQQNDQARPLEKSVLDTVSISNPSDPKLIDRQVIDRVLPETIHLAQSKIFIGSDRGLIIYGLDTPEKPRFISLTNHFKARDPIVIEDDRAYVTLRDWPNELIIYDISSLQQPLKLSTFQMTFPWGLGVKNSVAYICDGSAGLKILSVAEPTNVAQVGSVETDLCFDIVVTDGGFISTGFSGITQYEADKTSGNIKKLSQIAISE